MSKHLFIGIFFFFSLIAKGQELNCQIIVNAEQTGRSSESIFKTLENSLTEFVNQQNWTDKNLKPGERINCSMFINISSYDGNTFSGSIQVQSSRPVFGSSMVSPVFNFNDEQLKFNYTEYEPLDFDPNEYDSNLISVISFYVYTILGLDADTFEKEGGTAYFEEANKIASLAQQNNATGWQAGDGNNSRYRLITDLLSGSSLDFRESLYTYHRKGLDIMHVSPQQGKEAIAETLLNLDEMNTGRPNSILLRSFFDAKANEIEQVFSGGPSIAVKDIIEALNNMAPTLSDNWINIRP